MLGVFAVAKVLFWCGKYEIVLLVDLATEDHLLRKIDAEVNFSYIHDLCKDLRT